MKRFVILSGLAVFVLLSVTPLRAQERSEGPRSRGREFRIKKDQFNLTPEQKANFKELRRNFVAENAQLIGGLVTKRLELRSLWTDPKADPQAILAKEKEVRDLQNQMRDKVVQREVEARKFLTADQIANWKPGWLMPHRRGMKHAGMMQGGAGMGHGHGMDWRGGDF
jgi:Spy/CpxP family protein refolding chaperone